MFSGEKIFCFLGDELVEGVILLEYNQLGEEFVGVGGDEWFWKSSKIDKKSKNKYKNNKQK